MFKIFILLITINFLFCKSEKKAEDNTFYVNASELLIRESPDRKSKKIGSLNRLERVTLLQESNNEEVIEGIKGKWVQVKTNNSLGWVFSGYLLKEKPKINFDFPEVEINFPEDCSLSSFIKLNPSLAASNNYGSGEGDGQTIIIKNISIQKIKPLFDCGELEGYFEFDTKVAYNSLLKNGIFKKTYPSNNPDNGATRLTISISSDSGNIVFEEYTPLKKFLSD